VVDERDYEALVEEIRSEFPDFRIVRKDESKFQRAIDGALKVVTFGQQREYLTRYQTTIGYTVYVTPDWMALPPAQRIVTLRHERVHLRQFRRWSRPAMSLFYMMGPLPAGLSYFRMRMEREAYEESIRAASEIYGRAHVEDPDYKEYVISQFTSGSYGWMWPFRSSLERWYDGVVKSLP
jgi:hypothetical protein